MILLMIAQAPVCVFIVLWNGLETLGFAKPSEF